MERNSKWGGGKTLVGGTAFTVPFSKGIPLNTITPGAILYLNESGSPVPFYIAKHDYESGLNGAGRTLVVRKITTSSGSFAAGNAYADGPQDVFCNQTYVTRFDAAVQKLIGTTKIYYTRIGGSGLSPEMLERSAFALSATELGISGSTMNVEGTTLPIARSIRKADYKYWTRTPVKNSRYQSIYIEATEGAGLIANTDNYNNYRPAFTLPGNLGLAQNPDGTYTLAA